MAGCGGSPPRDPNQYEYSKHFVEDSMPDPARFLTMEMITETISEGRDCDRIEAGAGLLRRKKTFDGVNAVLVLPEKQAKIVTGWTEIECMMTACASERWSTSQIRTISEFEEQQEDVKLL